MRKEEAHKTVEYLMQTLISAKLHSGLKKNSIKYIEYRGKCPVYNKPIHDKKRMIQEIDQ